MDSLSKFLSQCVTFSGALFGSAFGVAAMNSDHPAIWAGLATVGIGSAVLGSISWVFSHKRAKAAYFNRQEQRMISVAKAKYGRITDVELVAETRYPLEECRGFLKRMTESGSAEISIGNEGTMVYLFPGFLSDEEKRSAKPVATWEPPLGKRAAQKVPPALDADKDASQSAPRSLELE